MINHVNYIENGSDLRIAENFCFRRYVISFSTFFCTYELGTNLLHYFSGSKYSIKLLDYFGFECFNKNNYFQLLVNCFNEQMHYHYLQRIFAWEMTDLENEEIEFTPIHFYNNKDTLNELLGKPDGLFSLIDDASKKGLQGKYITGELEFSKSCKQ